MSDPHVPSIDYTAQAKLQGKREAGGDTAAYAFSLVSKVADILFEKGVKRGLIVVIGDFDPETGPVTRMRQMGPNVIAGKFMRMDDKNFLRMITVKDELGDGAVVIDGTGQVLGAGAYVVVDHPEANIPEEGSTRHLAAASVSMRDEIIAAITLSEETGIVRLFENGSAVRTYDPRKATRAKSKRKKKKKKKEPESGDAEA